MPDEIFVYDRTPDPAWQADLDRIAPTGGRANWLKIAWMPGETYEPVQRWVIYEVITQLHTVPPDFLADIRGPDPRTIGFWGRDKGESFDRWHSDSLVSHAQWKLFNETGGYPNLTWIIQGDRGGHLYKLGPTEISALEEAGGDLGTDTPLPGDLPYADYDKRVASKLAERDRLRRWRRGMSWDERGMTKTEAGLLVRRERREVEMEYNMRTLEWLNGQIDDAMSDLSRGNAPNVSDFSHVEPVRVDEDEAMRAFVEDTSTTVEV